MQQGDTFPRGLNDKRTWKKQVAPYEDIILCTGRLPGYCGKCTATSHEVDYFDELLGDVPRFMVTATNRTPRDEDWVPVNLGELYAFLGVLVIMGYHELPEISQYFSTDADLGVRAVREAFTRKRFTDLWKFVRYSSQPSLVTGTREHDYQKDAEQVDPIVKVRKMLQYVNHRFRMFRNPGKYVCIDETMTAYKGRSNITVHMPKKPIKCGFEHFTVCDAETGYVLNDETHVGREVSLFCEEDEIPLPEFAGNRMGSITLYTIRHYLGKGYVLVCDNRFTSAELFEYLFVHHNTTAVGTLRANSAQMPVDYGELKKARGVERGHIEVRQSGRLLLTVWKDTKAVAFLSTDVDPTDPCSQVQRRVGGNRVQVKCPPAAVSYGDSYKGVDIANHLAASFRIGRRCRQWHRYFLHHKLNQVCVNAMINMLDVNEVDKQTDYRSQLSFRRAIASQLVRRGGQQRIVPEVSPRIRNHHLGPAGKSRRCNVCYRYRRERHESVLWCSVCKVNICRPKRRDCFELHKQGLDKEFA